MPHARPHRLRRIAVYAALATLLGVVSLTLSQCTMVGDSLTGVGLSKHGPTTCIKQCNNLYKVLFSQEQKLHLANNAACAGDAGCLAAELARHQAAMAALGQAKIDCQNNCHSQGGGSAG